jgi:hypothetical protein
LPRAENKSLVGEHRRANADLLHAFKRAAYEPNYLCMPHELYKRATESGLLVQGDSSFASRHLHSLTVYGLRFAFERVGNEG